MKQKKLRIAVIGCGSIAHAHIKNYLQFDDVELVAAARHRAGKSSYISGYIRPFQGKRLYRSSSAAAGVQAGCSQRVHLKSSA